MAGKISELTGLSSASATDLVEVVDVSDTTYGTSGTNKKSTLQVIADFLASLSQTLTNKTLTSPVITTPTISSIVNTGTLTLPTSTDTLVGKATTDVLTNKTVNLTSNTLSGTTAQFNTALSDNDFATQAGTETLTNKTISTGSKLDANADGNFTYNSLFRQALINGNFDVWQRGTSGTDQHGLYLADRFEAIRSGGVAGISVSRQDGTGVSGSLYCGRIQRANGNAATNTITITQMIEGVNAKLLRGKKQTLSFYARKGANYSATSDALNVRIITGTGADENIKNGYTGQADAYNGNVTLTTSWQKFSMTTTAVIADTVTEMCIYITETPTGTASTNDYFEITQVQLCAGDVALPFSPKSFDEELRACQRYYEKSYNYTVAAPTTASPGYEYFTPVSAVVGTIANQQIYGRTVYKVQKRISVTPTIYPYTTVANTGCVSDGAGTDLAANSGAFADASDKGFRVYNNTGGNLTSSLNRIIYHWTADAEL